MFQWRERTEKCKGVEEHVLEQGEAMRSLGGAEEFTLEGSLEVPLLTASAG